MPENVLGEALRGHAVTEDETDQASATSQLVNLRPAAVPSNLSPGVCLATIVNRGHDNCPAPFWT